MDARLGDVIDDYCIKCKRLTNHAVVSLMEGQPAKVRCRTCYNDHDYRHELQPPPKVDPRKAAQLLEAAAATVPAEGEAAVADGAPKVKAKAKGRK